LAPLTRNLVRAPNPSRTVTHTLPVAVGSRSLCLGAIQLDLRRGFESSAMLRVVDESPRELDELRSQLEARFQELNDDLTKVTSSYSWQLVGIKKPHIWGTQKIAVAYVLLSGGAMAIGIVLSLLGRSLESLGVALVVGAIFSFGAFVAQFWAVASQREFETRSAVFGEIDELKARYNKEVIPLAERIQALESEEKSDFNSAGTG
jgi:hypothetical protein